MKIGLNKKTKFKMNFQLDYNFTRTFNNNVQVNCSTRMYNHYMQIVPNVIECEVLVKQK